jgi:inosine-uridine nucleoside N-ribohydrolase
MAICYVPILLASTTVPLYPERDYAWQREAITVVAGNVPLDQGVQNALYTVELCRGQSIVDHLHYMNHEPNAEVVTEASRDQFLKMLFEAVT